MDICEKCGSKSFESRWQGLSYEFRCSKCYWGAVTTRVPPIVADECSYRIIITSLGADPNRSLIALNRRFGHGILRTRQIFSSGEHQLFVGRAFEVWWEAQLLRSEQVPFRIDPAFPYNLDTCNAEHEHEHDWLPLAPPNA
jgi:hypothetical protein